MSLKKLVLFCFMIVFLGGITFIYLVGNFVFNSSVNLVSNEETMINRERQLEKMGINKRNLKAKIAGGAKMFSFNSGSSDIGNIGNKNIEAVRARLESHRIKIVSEDVGLDYGRTIIFDPDSCELSVIKAGKQVKII